MSLPYCPVMNILAHLREGQTLEGHIYEKSKYPHKAFFYCRLTKLISLNLGFDPFKRCL